MKTMPTKPEATAAVGPRTPSLAPAPLGEWWNETQWAVLLSLLDAIVTPIVASDDPRRQGSAVEPEDGFDFDRTSVQRLPRRAYDEAVDRARASMVDPPSASAIADYLADRPSDSVAFQHGLRRAVSGLTTDLRNQLGGILSILSWSSGAFLLTGYYTPVQQQPVDVREAILRGWSASWLPDLRKLARSVYALAQTSYLLTAPRFRQVSGYADVPAGWTASTSVPAYDFVQFGGDTDTASLETDVVIVGSGCGGAVCAQVLAAAGHRVVVVDKAYHYPPEQLPLPQETGTRLLYENGGILASTDPCINVLAGACWGGGGTINWSVCLRPPAYVRREWAGDDQQSGMAFVTSSAFDACLDRVCDFMGVHEPDVRPADAEDQSHRGRVLLDGAAKLGWAAAPLLQNTRGGRPHDCGHCHLGCASAQKRGTAVRWLPAAAADGAQFVEGFHVDRVLFDGDDGSSEQTPITIPLQEAEEAPRATGIVGTWLSRDADGSTTGPEDQRTKRRVVIKAKRVIVSGGSLCSPLVLLRSGLTNPQIGKNLHLHPCNFVGAYFDEETKPMDKGIITSICTSFEDLDGRGHGPRLESTCMVPYAILANLPWRSGLDFKLAALRYRHYDGFIALTRDRGSGRVLPDRHTGQPVVDYHPDPVDREHAVEGVIGLARLCHAAGAREIRAYLPGVPPFLRPDAITEPADTADTADTAFENWITSVRAAGNALSALWNAGKAWATTTPFASAHQMGTCRMGDDAGAASVVDPRGRVWGTRGLYVADASVFPSASGVNPMVTTMAFADWIAQSVAASLADA